MSSTQVTISEAVTIAEDAGLSPREQLTRACHGSHRRRYWQQVDKDSYVCPMCDREGRREFEVHHINQDWMDGRQVNLVGLCVPCHRKVHRVLDKQESIEAWKQDFQSLGGGG